MNLNEVEKHVKFDIIFNLLIYIGIGLCLILSLIVILATPAKAASNNINSNSHSTCGSSMGSGSYYGAFQNGNCYSRSIGTTYSGQASLVGFWLNYNFQAGKYYTITINFKDNDLLSSTIVDVVRVIDVGNNRNEWTNTYNFISKKQFKVYFLAPNNTNSLAVSLASGSGDPITGVSNYGIASIYLDDNDNSDEIINANNENTQNIISNNNANTENIINSINNGLTDLCTNRFNNFDIYQRNGVDNVNITPNNIMLQSDNAWANVVYRLPVESGKTYYFKGSFSSATRNSILLSLSYNGNDIVNTRFWNYEPYTDTIGPIQTGSWSTSFVADRNGYVYLGIWVNKVNSGNNASYFELTFNTDDKPFCVFGSTISKIDEQIKGQQEANRILNELGFKTDETNAYLKDDTNPSVNTSGIDDVMSSVEISDPLNYLLTLPLNLLTKLNQVLSANSCSRVSFGTLYDTELYLPCINFEQILGSNIWGTIDLIVGVGLLVVIFKRFYDSISNVLTLGKEKEVRDKLDLPTPMQFLASILGGGRD